jgi:hypothetical protein
MDGQGTVTRFTTFWRTLDAILCANCIGKRTTAILCKLLPNQALTCTLCGVSNGHAG